MWFSFLTSSYIVADFLRFPYRVYSEGIAVGRSSHKVESFLYIPDFIILHKVVFQVLSEPPTFKLYQVQ